MNYDEMSGAYALDCYVVPITNNLSREAFSGFACTLLGEWCNYNNYDIKDLMDELRRIIRLANEE